MVALPLLGDFESEVTLRFAKMPLDGRNIRGPTQHSIHEIHPTDGLLHANLRSRLAILRLACRFSPFSPPPFFLGRGASTSDIKLSGKKVAVVHIDRHTDTKNLVEPLRIREPDQEATRSDERSRSDENVLEIQERYEAEDDAAYP